MGNAINFALPIKTFLKPFSKVGAKAGKDEVPSALAHSPNPDAVHQSNFHPSKGL